MHTSDIGSHFIVGISGTELSDADKRILDEIRPGGILLLKRNFAHDKPYEEWIKTLKNLLGNIRSRIGRDDILITLDHEGGRVHRTPPPITHFPAPSKCITKSIEVAKAMALELRSLGVNVSWAPLADINSNPQNPIIGDRAFGNTPNIVIEHAVKVAETLLSEGIIPCGKHYPGHGDTKTDSHLELPVLDLSRKELEERELKPFAALVAAKIPMLMTAHVLFSSIDPKNPATLSKILLNNIVRDEWRYEGVIVSDDLDMLAVAKQFEIPETIGNAVIAGCDMFIAARHPDGESLRPLLFAQNLLSQKNNRQEVAQALEKSAKRISLLRSLYATSYDVETLPMQIFKTHQGLANSL